MTVKPTDTAFSKSFGTVQPVILTDSSGNILEAVTDAPNIYRVDASGNATTDFYLDYDGSEFQQPLNVGAFTSSNDVAMTMKYFWIVDAQEVEKTSYLATVAATSADDILTTGYSPGEYVPKGTKHLMRVATTTEASGNYYVYGYAMSARY